MFTMNMDLQTQEDLDRIQFITGLRKSEIISALIKEKAEDMDLHEDISIWEKKKGKK